MSDKLEAYLEEISHFLSGRAEREEILNEIRSHVAEKAAEGPGEFTDAEIYGGSGVGNMGVVHAEEIPWHGRPFSAAVRVPPLGALWLRPA